MVDREQFDAACRRFGEQRLDAASEATRPADWDRLWKDPANACPIEHAGDWDFCIELHVEDFAAEVGFFTDVIGCGVKTLSKDFAMFAGPGEAYFFAVRPTGGEHPATPSDGVRLGFRVRDIRELCDELKRRDVPIEREAEPRSPDDPLLAATFRTPNGVALDLWGAAE